MVSCSVCVLICLACCFVLSAVFNLSFPDVGVFCVQYWRSISFGKSKPQVYYFYSVLFMSAGLFYQCSISVLAALCWELCCLAKKYALSYVSGSSVLCCVFCFVLFCGCSVYLQVIVLKKHFSAYDKLSSVELENVGSIDAVPSKNCLAHISSTTRRSVERAFVSDANPQLAGQVTSVDSPKVANSGNGESENLERKDSSGECTEQDKDLQSSLSAMSSD
ncbi:hypothetical protein LOK49_LG01G04064 [Camellia lanceoleosa]|uniref:Uncharacterized protein n=1 Tax=Camellia lanceoleosa TaxID=1840588 RepID=A0ACC0J1N7_9ERIC|nr:hypothetical protein LOK49_LG01G04064 [Camellia lanceoleosa]